MILTKKKISNNKHALKHSETYQLDWIGQSWVGLYVSVH